MLWRALGHVPNGRYVDIGAQSPIVDSVSRLFHEAGWTGVHVEPVEAYAEALRQARPGDIVIQAAVSDMPGLLTFHRIPDTGLSTLSAEVAAGHAGRGFAYEEVVVPAVTLDDVLIRASEGEIHWLKIDVEGSEAAVLRSWRASPVRPWVLVIEATQPMSEAQTHDEWDALVLDKGYRLAWFDGLNRFFVSDAHPELMDAFSVAPNVFDRFAIGLDGSALFAAEFRAKLAEADARLDAMAREKAAALDASALFAAESRAKLVEADARLDAMARENATALDTMAREKAAALDAGAVLAEQHAAQVAALQAAQSVERKAYATELAEFAKSLVDAQSNHAWERNVWHQERAALEQQLADRAAAERSWEATARLRKQQLDTMYASTSWKVSAPLRGIKLFAHAVLRRLRGEAAAIPQLTRRAETLPTAAAAAAAAPDQDEASLDVGAALSERGRFAASLLHDLRRDRR